MGLSIKNEETERLVRELARRKGVGVTTAIKLAVSNELAATPPLRAKDPEAVMAAVRKIQEEVKGLPVLMSSEDVDAWMYDENGLPH
jgi:antitoxin VapB